MSFITVDSGKAEASILAQDERRRRNSSIPRLQDGIALSSGFTRSLLKGFLQGDQLPVLRAALVNVNGEVSEVMVYCNWKNYYCLGVICGVVVGGDDGVGDYSCNGFVAVARRCRPFRVIDMGIPGAIVVVWQ